MTSNERDRQREGPPTPDEPTRTAESVGASTEQPAVAPSLFRAQERYQILGEHGRGGLGKVSRALDRELGRDVAIKELIARGAIGEVRFLREAMITARLEHPGIVPVHEAGRWADGTPYYAMKLVAGRPLRELIAERRTVDQRVGLLHHVIAVADAIAYAHGRNIIHRDLKPSNIIVGEFGETVVIDWGLAKELSSVEESGVGGGPFRAPLDEGLTVAGAVLGTPSYMAPEQMRGEQVDQRADVFAIGMMLWELCSLERVPPTDVRHRRRLLRRAGIDQDLAIIIDKALEPDREGRYKDAGALAADLKAFKSGARIAARSYSLFGMLVHWTRRRRAVALAAAVAVVVAAAGIIVYVRDVASERDRADSALARVEATKDELAAEHAELTLKHAELLLTSDPSAAIDSLRTYHGPNRDRADQLRAEAEGRGVAALRAEPHHDNVRWAEGQADGSVVSLSTDGTIVRTLADGRSVMLARNAARKGYYAYAPSAGVLAYGCDPANVCMWDVHRGVELPVAKQIGEVQLAGMSFSPSGSRFAVIADGGLLRVFDMSVRDRPAERFRTETNGGLAVLFLDEDSIAVAARESLQVVRESGRSPVLSIGDVFFWTASADATWMALGTMAGEGLLVEVPQMKVAKRVDLCRGTVSGARFVPGQQRVAFSCREGTVGLWDLVRNETTPLVHLDGHVDIMELSRQGDQLVAAGGNGTFAVIDLVTHLMTMYRGHRARLTAAVPATTEFPFHISADVRGALRTWPTGRRLARVVGSVHTRFASAAFRAHSNTLIAATLLPSLTTYSASEGLESFGPHIASNSTIELASNANKLATYGRGESIEIWSSLPMERTSVIRTDHGTVSKVVFVEGTDDVLTSGRDGRVVRWNSRGEPQVLGQLGAPIAMFVRAPATGSLAIATTDGALWELATDGSVMSLRPPGNRISALQTLPDQSTVGVGYSNGDTIVIDTRTHEQRLLLHVAEAIRDIAITPDGKTIAVAAHDDTIYIGDKQGATWAPEAIHWRTLGIRARRIALAPDGLLAAIDTDGDVWIHSTSRHASICIPTGTADLTFVKTSDDGMSAAVLDSDGRIVWIDLEPIRSTMNARSAL